MTDQEKKQEIEDFDLSNHIYENYLYSGKEADAVADLLKQNTDIAYEFCSSLSYGKRTLYLRFLFRTKDCRRYRMLESGCVCYDGPHGSISGGAAFYS